MNTAVIAFLQAHETAICVVVLWVSGAFVSSLPTPTATSHPFYQWFYKFANLIVANLDKLGAPK